MQVMTALCTELTGLDRLGEGNAVKAVLATAEIRGLKDFIL